MRKYIIICIILFIAVTVHTEESFDNERLVKRSGLRYVYQYNTASHGHCDKPATPEFGFSYFHSTHIGAVVVHKCKPGYKITGAKLRVCKANGQWLPGAPKCVYASSQTCKDPGSLTNGIVLVSSIHVHSIVKYKCHYGYRLVGNNYQVCRASGQWTGSLPKCVPLGCEALSDPANGKVMTTSLRYGAVATYSCNNGFELVGKDKSRVCRPSGEWSGVAPSCHGISCGSLADPKNGKVQFSSSNVGSVAKYTCNAGFLLVGASERTCQKNREWTGITPVCRPLSCGRLDSPSNGKVIISGTTPGSIATYSCNGGFTLMGQYKRTCQISGEWSGVEPNCKPIKCQRLFAPANGLISFSSSSVDSQRPGDKAVYSCQEGFRLNGGTRIRVCQQDGSYSGEAPSCKSISCGILRDPPNGRVELTNERLVDEQATYTCNTGFDLIGANVRTCLKNGAWSGEEPLCKPVDCGHLLDPTNGRVTVTTTRLGGIAKYSCRDGFKIVGIIVRRCLANGHWSREPPFCKANSCGILNDPRNGRIRLRGTSVGSFAIYICNRGFQLVGGAERRVCLPDTTWSGYEPHCKPITCEILTDPLNGVVSARGTSPGSVATYTCNEGFRLVGISTRICALNGVYTGAAPTCERIKCQELDDPLNGRVSVSGDTPGSEATYTCNDGFIINGERVRVCRNDGTFTGQQPFCQPISCEQLPSIDNGQVLVSDNRPGAVATYTCNPGFNLIGQVNRICQSDGTFDGREPTCERIDCGLVSTIPNGRIEFTTTTVGSVVNYICNNGYTLTGGDSQRICKENGVWSGSEPSCNAIDCGTLAPLLNGDIDFTSTTFLSKATYSCRARFELVGGTVTRVCQSNGQWTGTAPTCQPIRCELLDNPINGQVLVSDNDVGSVATYNCNPGFELIGNERRICRENGRYDGTAPTCTAITCSPLTDPLNGQVSFDSTTVGSQATYSCLKGFTLVGVSNRLCTLSGQWSGEEPSCTIISCNPLDPIPNGEVTFTSTQYGSVATYSCNFGFILTGTNTRSCQLNGQWSDSQPFCKPVECDQLTPPTNGHVELAETIVNSVATYTCLPGFKLVGKETRTCQSDGQWSERPPICQSIDCGPLLGPEYGTVTVTGTSTGSIASYKCNKGFKLNGVVTRICLNSGEWSLKAPVCEPEDCGPLKDPENGQVDASGTAFWDTATYSCNPGYEIVGKEVRSCQENGQWSDVAPFCQSVNCGILESPKNGRVSFTGTTISSVATYSCFNGYNIVGDASRTCEKDGQWSGHAPFCEAAQCGQLNDPENGQVTIKGTGEVFSMASYSCNTGFGLIGVSSRICQTDGTWSDTAPTCEPSDCGQLLSPDNGMVKTTGTKYWDTADYSCMPGYNLLGETTRTCQDSGKWSGEAPVCIVVDCHELQSPENGRVLFTSTTFRSEANYLCNKGYQLVGEQTRECQADGQWSGSAPFCESVTCSQLTVPLNGQLELSQGNLAGSLASYTCNHGFQLVGTDERKCLATGQWSGADPLCQSITCGDLFDILNGQVTVTGTTVGSVATYTCNSGFELAGKNTRNCLITGKWSGVEPRCKPGGCSPLNSPVNGNVHLSGTGVGDTATYRCQSGFRLIGDKLRVCDISGQWTNSAPTCVLAQCAVLTSPINGHVTVQNSNAGSSATYTCDDGYILIGNKRRLCLRTEEWTGTDPTCKAVDCGRLSPPTDGDIRVSSTTFGSSARYTCSIGFSLVGLAFRVCQLNGRWSGKAPTCRVNQCPVLLKPVNGRITLTGTSFGSSATYKCNRGFQLIGEEKRLCKQDSTWSGADPICQAINCGPLISPDNGEVSFTTTNFGSVALYTCNDKYDIVGTRRRTCQESGKWSGRQPTCKIKLVDCGTLPNPLNGQVLLSGTSNGATATYTCLVGYTIVGSDIRYCGIDGIWSGVEPTCRPLDCGQLLPPANGEIKYIGTGFGAIARYSCFHGYRLEGDVSRTCKSNGEWSGQTPLCLPVAPPTTPPPPLVGCGDPGTPANGRKIGNSYNVGSIVYYECDSGFKLVGSKSRLCRFDGQWSDVLPSCVGNGQCVGTERVEDKCGQVCSCVNGRLTNCCRLRRDYAAYTDEEKKRYIDAVIKVSKNTDYQSKYVKLVEKYKSSYGTPAQSSTSSSSQFFVWNRFFLLEFENLLREVDCRITLPYYDWTILNANPYIHPVYDDTTGFGKSSRESDKCVSSGYFKYDSFSLVPSSGGGCLKRDYNKRKFPSRGMVERDLLTRPASEFADFQRSLQLFMHTNVRCFIGGTMCSPDAANDPIFVLHLTMIDYLYTRWQSFDEERLKARYSNDDTPLVLSDGNFIVSQFYDNKKLPNAIAVCYSEPRVKNHVPASLYFLAHSFSEVSARRENFYMNCISREKFIESGQELSTDEQKYLDERCSSN